MQHQREVETLLIRAAGPFFEFNEKKRRVDPSAVSISDYKPSCSSLGPVLGGTNERRDQAV